MDWDDEVDVLCLGMGGTAVAAGIVAARAGLEVYVGISYSPGDWVGAGCTDEQTLALFHEYGDVFGVRSSRTPELPVRVVDDLDPPPVKPRRRGQIEPFFGSKLLDWARDCVASPYSLLYDRVTEREMTPMRSRNGEQVEAAIVGTVDLDSDWSAPDLNRWLADEAAAEGVELHIATELSRLVFEEGLLVGAVLNTQSGPWAVRAHHDVIIETGAAGGDAVVTTATAQSESSTMTVALVSRNASRFGRLELLTEHPSAGPGAAAASLATGSSRQ